MPALLRNEVQKLLKKRKITITLVVMLLAYALLSLGGWFINHQNSPAKQMENLKNYQNYIEVQQKNAKTEDEKKNLELQLTQQKQKIEQLQASIDHPGDWKTTAQNKIDALKKTVETQDKNARASTELQIRTLQNALDTNTPISQEGEQSGVKIIYIVSVIFSMLIMTFLVAVVTSDIVSGESTEGTIKILLIQPVSRGKILLSKFLTAFLTMTVLTMLSEVLVLLITGVMFGFGNFAEPVGIGLRYVIDPNLAGKLNEVAGSGFVTSFLGFMGLHYLLRLVYFAAATAFCLLCSVIFSRSITSNIASLAFIVATTFVVPIMSSFSIRDKVGMIMQYVFSAYNTGYQVLEGSMVQMLVTPGLNYLQGMIVCGIWAVVCYVASHVIFNRKDVTV